MSSFMVSEETINRILSWFSLNQYRDAWCSRQLQKIGFSVEDAKAFDALGQAMLEMNREAVNQRYHEKETVKEKFTFRLSMVSSFQALKSLRCFLYQCAEGSVPDKALYKTLDNIADGIAMEIVNSLPQYESAVWG